MSRTPPARTAGQRPLIALVAGVVLAIAATSRPGRVTAAPGDGAVPGGGTAVGEEAEAEAGRTAEVVGPVRGTDVDAYVAERSGALLEAGEDVDTAVVSFSALLRIQDALLALGDAVEVRAVLYRLPLDLSPPVTVRVGPGDDPVAAVAASLEEQLGPIREEEDALRELLDSGTVDDAEFEAEYRRRVEALAAARTAIEGDGALVHAVVVRAPVEVLRDLQDATAVRLVDPAPAGTDAGLSVFHGLLPSDEDTVSFGRVA